MIKYSVFKNQCSLLLKRKMMKRNKMDKVFQRSVSFCVFHLGIEWGVRRLHTSPCWSNQNKNLNMKLFKIYILVLEMHHNIFLTKKKNENNFIFFLFQTNDIKVKNKTRKKNAKDSRVSDFLAT